MTPLDDKPALRRHFRAVRREALAGASPALRAAAVASLPELLPPGRWLGLYWPVGSEPDLDPWAPDGLAERLVRVTLRMLDEPETRDQIAAMVRDGAGAAKATAPLREFLESVIVDRVAAVLGVPDARMRATLALSYIVGVAGSRYVLRMEPLASATEDELVRLVTPAVQAALSGSS